MSQINQKPPSFPEEEQNALDLVDKVVGDSLEAGDFDYAANLISRYRSLNRISEMAVSKTLHGVNLFWGEVEHENGDDYFSWSVRATGYNGRTVERHLGVWEMLSGHYIPGQYIYQIRTHTIRQLFKIYSLVTAPRRGEKNYSFVDQDYRIEDEDWLALSEATDEQRVAEIVNDIKDKPRNKNFMSLKVDESGGLWVLQNGAVHQCGQLFVKSPYDLVQKAVSRIVDRSGITQRDEY